MPSGLLVNTRAKARKFLAESPCTGGILRRGVDPTAIETQYPTSLAEKAFDHSRKRSGAIKFPLPDHIYLLAQGSFCSLDNPPTECKCGIGQNPGIELCIQCLRLERKLHVASIRVIDLATHEDVCQSEYDVDIPRITTGRGEC